MSIEHYYQKLIRIPPGFLSELKEAERYIRNDPRYFEIGVPGRKGSFSKFVRTCIKGYLKHMRDKEAAKNEQSDKDND